MSRLLTSSVTDARDSLLMRYVPNAVHKRTWTDAGPPSPRSDKTPCPTGITLLECQALLESSVPESPDDPRTCRYAVRRESTGVEVFAAQVHSPAGHEPIELHGYPVPTAPARVLREFKARGDLTELEYRRLVRSLS